MKKYLGAALAAAVLWSPQASPFGLKTHLWVAQQIHADVADDCRVVLAGQSYAVPEADCGALRAHPDAFFAGILGPDIYPDILTGQTTAHPGIDGGWGNADFTSHLLDNAGDGQQRAYALGYLLHGAADAMAHTYVNHYAGDIFDLSGERTAEVRHILIERYIDAHLPPFQLPGIEAPHPFVRDQLVHNAQSAPQHMAAGAAHTPAMLGVRDAVVGTVDAAEALEQIYVGLAREYIHAHVNAMAQQVSGETALQTAELAFQARSAELQVRKAALDEAVVAIDAAKRAYADNEGAILRLTSQAEAQRQLSNAAADAARQFQSLLHDYETQRIGLDGQVLDLGIQLANTACTVLEEEICPENCPIIFLPCVLNCEIVTRTICDNRDAVAQALNAAQTSLSSVRQLIADTQNELAQTAVRQAAATNNAVMLTQEKTQREAQRASLNAALDSAKTVAAAQEGLYILEKAAYDQAAAETASLREQVAALRKQTVDAKAIADTASRLVDELNLLSLFFRNWVDGIDKSGAEFVKTGERVGVGMLAGHSNLVAEYQRWMGCHGSVYLATPYQAANLPCQLEPEFLKAKATLDRLLALLLPPPLDQLQAEIRRFEKQFMDEVGKAVDRATIELTRMATDERTAQLVELFVAPDNGSDTILEIAFTTKINPSDTTLVMFPDIRQMLRTDIGLQDEVIQPARFETLEAALTMSRLALVRGAEWERVVADLGGEEALQRFRTLAVPVEQSLLQQSLRSIDGNHQWQPYGLPYPRRATGAQPVDPEQRRFGYGGPGDARRGFWLYRDPVLRRLVFLKLFPAQIHGSMHRIPEMQPPLMSFPICDRNPFPATSDGDGRPVAQDLGCVQAVSDDPEVAEE